jgi:hypothetical protein
LLPATAFSVNGHSGPALFLKLLSVTALSALGHFGVLPSPPMSTGISFDHYNHRCQDFCSLYGFRLTLEEQQCTQPRPCAQTSGAGMVASRSGLLVSEGSLGPRILDWMLE